MISTQYNGEPDNEKLHAVYNISSSTNATPIVVTTSAAHDFTEGDHVYVSGHATNTQANGVRAVHVIDGFNIALYTSVSSAGLSGAIAGNGVGGATGTVQGIGLLPTFQLPSDGDGVTAASVNVGLEAGGDAYQFLAERVGLYKVVLSQSRSLNGLSSGTAAPVFLGNGNATNTTWHRDSANGGATPIDFFDGGTYPYPHVQNGDIIELRWSVALVDTTVVGHGALYVAIGCEFFEEGTSPTIVVGGVATSQKIQGSARYVPDNALGRVDVDCKFTVTGLPRQQLMQGMIVTRTVAGGAVTWAMYDDLQWSMRITRPTGMVI